MRYIYYFIYSNLIGIVEESIYLSKCPLGFYKVSRNLLNVKNDTRNNILEPTISKNRWNYKQMQNIRYILKYIIEFYLLKKNVSKGKHLRALKSLKEHNQIHIEVEKWF